MSEEAAVAEAEEALLLRELHSHNDPLTGVITDRLIGCCIRRARDLLSQWRVALALTSPFFSPMLRKLGKVVWRT